MNNQRNVGLDVVRSLAIIFVILIHAIGFSVDGYSIPLIGVDGFCRIYLRRICYTCVPLFLILSGFLNVKKINAVETWKKAMPHLLGTYHFWCIVILVFGMLYLDEVFSVKSVASIFNYTVPRTWYMNMYLGLLMLMPFINKCWNSMEQKEKRTLLVVLFSISMLSKYLQSASSQWFSGESYLVIVSNYFEDASYIFYYLFGAYVREHPISIRKRWLFATLQLILVSHTGYYLLVGWGGVL